MSDDCTEVWETVARDLAARECDRRRAVVEDEFYTLADRLRADEEIRPQDIKQARCELNALRRLLEEQLAPLAGLEPWDSYPPSMPLGAAREHYHIDLSPDVED